MRILFLHGLEGELSEVKRDILQKYGEVISPKMDYRLDSNIINTLYEQFASENISAVIGSSLGGFTGYYLSLLLNTPCLVFNPALPYRSIEQSLPESLPYRDHYLQLVLGGKDEIIRSKDNLDFLNRELSADTNSRIHIINQLEHRIPAHVFEKEVNIFFTLL